MDIAQHQDVTASSWDQECLNKVLLKMHGIIKRKWHHSIISLSWAWGSLKGCLLTLLGTFLLSRKSLYLCNPSSWEIDCPVLLAGSSLSSLTFCESHTCISNTVIYFQPSVLYWALATILMIPKIREVWPVLWSSLLKLLLLLLLLGHLVTRRIPLI